MASYHEATFGREEPEMGFCNGKTLLWLRAKAGIADLKDSNGVAIREGQVYLLTPGRAVPFDLPFEAQGKPFEVSP